MSNNLFNQFNSNSNNNIFGQLQNFMSQNRGIDPRAEVNKMLQSGKLNQNQFNQIWNQAQSIAKMLNIK